MLPKLLMRELRKAAAMGVFEAFTMACRTVLRLLFTAPCSPSCWHVPSGQSMYKDFVACRTKPVLLRGVSNLYRTVTWLAGTCLQQLSVREKKQGYAELKYVTAWLLTMARRCCKRDPLTVELPTTHPSQCSLQVQAGLLQHHAAAAQPVEAKHGKSLSWNSCRHALC